MGTSNCALVAARIVARAPRRQAGRPASGARRLRWRLRLDRIEIMADTPAEPVHRRFRFGLRTLLAICLVAICVASSLTEYSLDVGTNLPVYFALGAGRIIPPLILVGMAVDAVSTPPFAHLWACVGAIVSTVLWILASWFVFSLAAAMSHS